MEPRNPPRKTLAKPKGGRPRKLKATPAAAPTWDELTGMDPALFDWRRVLAGIAIDPATPANARVAACKALMKTAGPGDGKPTETPQDALTRRALQIMSSGRRLN